MRLPRTRFWRRRLLAPGADSGFRSDGLDGLWFGELGDFAPVGKDS